MNISELAVTLVLMTAVLSGLMLFYTDLAESHGKTPSELTMVNATERMRNRTESMRDIMKDAGDEGIIDFFWKGMDMMYNAALLPVDMIGVLTSIITDMSEAIGLPTWFTGSMIVIAMIFLVYKVLGIFMKREI